VSLLGINIILLLGIINLVLVFFQLTSGLKIIKVPFKLHKTCGILLAIGAVLHGVLAIVASL